MKRNFSVFFVLFLTISIASIYGQDPPGTATGQKIGTIVKTALNTALPEVSNLVKLIWPKNDPTKISKSDLETQLDQARTKLRVSAQAQIQPTLQISDELGVLNQFLDPTVQSYATIISMQTRLSLKDTLSKTEWAQQKTDWEVATNFLTKMKAISPNDLSLVKNMWLQLPLKKIQEANLTFITRINGAFEQKDSKKMRELLKDFTITLQDIPAIVGFEISALQSDLKGLSEWAKGAAGGQEVELTPEQKRYKNYIIKRYN